MVWDADLASFYWLQLRYLGVQKGLHPQQGAYTVVLIFAERYD